MKPSHAASLTLVAALALTLGAKAAWTRGAPRTDAQLFNRSVEMLLVENRFRTWRDVRPFGTLIHGRRAGCTLMIGDHNPHGTLAEAYAMFGRSIGPLHFVWRGQVSDRAPKLLPLMRFFVERELRRIGFRPARQPILAVAASEGCALDRIDWTALSSLPA